MMGRRSPQQLLGLRVLEGMLTGTVAAATALVATSAPKRGSAMPSVWCRRPSSPEPRPALFGGFAYDRIGPRATFVLAGAMLFCGGVTVAFLARERFTRRRTP